MSLHIQENMRTYKGTSEYTQKKGCLPIATWVETKDGFDMFFRHIFSDQRKHVGVSGWTFYPHDNQFTPGVYEISAQDAQFLRVFYAFQMKTILRMSYDCICSVCLQEMKKTQKIFIFKCKHTVHIQCCRKNNKQLHYYLCPNCRTGVERIDTITLQQQESICKKLVQFMKKLKKPKKHNFHPRYLYFSFRVQKQRQTEAQDNGQVNEKVSIKSKFNANSQIKFDKKDEPKLKKENEDEDQGWIIVKSKKKQPKPKCRYGNYGDQCRHNY